MSNKIPNHNITDYIPQREPIVMVSQIIEVNEKKVLTIFLITDDNIFCNEGYLQEPGLIENIAQSAAAMTGYNASINNEEVKKGFIGSVDNLNIISLPKSNTEIKTQVAITNQVMNVNIIKGTIWQNNNIVAECEMKIFLDN